MPKFIAFYLPQYHPIPENDSWWGAGFTEWTNVRRGRPNYEDHQQPKVPGDLGYYSLLDPAVQHSQAELAKKYGIYGFCYYVYWFGGKRLLEKPLDNLLADKEIDLPFCICWANENWTRRWDGRDDQVLISQKHTRENDDSFISDMLKYISDKRYIRIGDRPLILVYRADLLVDPLSTTNYWREVLQSRGLGDPYLVAVDFYNVESPAQFGFDALAEFPPHKSLLSQNRAAVTVTNPEFTGDIFDYRKIRDWFLLRSWKGFRMFRGVMPGWDNTARRQNSSHIFAHSTPQEFEQWLSVISRSTAWLYPQDERLVFINSWNEWGEGCYLEPDATNGYGYLEAVKRVADEAEDLEKFIDEKLGSIPADTRSQFAQIASAYERSLAAYRYQEHGSARNMVNGIASEEFWSSSQGVNLSQDVLRKRVRAPDLAKELLVRIKKRLLRSLQKLRAAG